jgi:hypothetical protein
MKPQGKKETLLKMLKRAWTSFSGGTVAEDEAEELGLQQDRERKTFEQSARGVCAVPSICLSFSSMTC